MGKDARAGIMLPSISVMADVPRLTLIEQRLIGKDWRLRFKS
jgi:hypothetical protein